MRNALYLIALAGLGLVGCRAEVRTKADFSLSGREDAAEHEDDSAIEHEPDNSGQPKALAAPIATTPTRASFIGVTPDLTLAPSTNRSAACMCLALAYGEPGASSFQWQGGVPEATENAMAVAISGEGVPCAWDEKGVPPPIPSIAGVERSGSDVILTIEPAREGRPVMRGAMILRPGPKGALIVKGKGRVPFGRPADGGMGTCRIAIK